MTTPVAPGQAKHMESAVPDSPPPRLLLPTSHADLRATWHADQAPGERSALVLSLWHDHWCAASARLSTEEAARLAGFLVDHLATRAIAAEDRAAQDRAAQDRAGEDGRGRDGAPAGDHRSNPAARRPLTSARPSDRAATVPLDVSEQRHLRAAPEPGAGQRVGATVDEAIAAGGAALTAAVDAARRTWRARRS